MEHIDAETGEVQWKAPFLRTPYNYNMMTVSDDTGLTCPPEEGMTQQQFLEESDINEIVRRFGLTGEMPETINMPVTGDFTGAKTFEESMLLLRKAEEGFMELPAEVRKEFDNDPGKLIAFLENPKNKDKAIEMGLVNKPPEVTRDVIQAIDEMAQRLPPPLDKKDDKK